MIDTNMAIKWLNFHLCHTPLNKIKNIDGKVIQSSELVSNGSYFSPTITYLRCYVTSGEGNIKPIISLRAVIKSDISVIKINSIKELPPYLKTRKQKKILLQEPFELSFSDQESILDGKKIRYNIEHKIIVDEALLEISDDEN